MTPSKIFFLTLISYCIASPIRPDSRLGLILGVPVVVDDPTDLQNKLEAELPRIQYTFYSVNQNDAKDSLERTSIEIDKRSAEETDEDDLETAAGTNALRPLFVYRQQVAYRQRVREANRRGNRF